MAKTDIKINGTWTKGDVYIKTNDEIWKFWYKLAGDTDYRLEVYTNYTNLVNALNGNIAATDVKIDQLPAGWKKAEKIYIKVNGTWQEAIN